MANVNFEKSLECLQSANSDNEKFAALLMVAKLTKAGSCDASQRKALFDAVGFKFLKRLLRTETVADGCTKWTYKCIAATILSCFCSDSQLSNDVEMLSTLPQLNEIITAIQESDSAEEERQLINDTYECLTCFAGQQAGIDALVQRKTITALCQSVAQQNLGWQKAHQLVMYVNNMRGVDAWRNNQTGLHIILQHYACLFNSHQGEEKFGYCRTLFIILSSIDASVLEGVDCSTWSQQIYESLCTILQSKLGADQREPALALSSAVVDLLGVEWALKANADGDSKFLLILVHLCCIEVRMTLEPGDFEKITTKGALLTGCYKLLENIISYMSTGSSLALDDKQVRQLHAAMVGAFNAVLLYLRAAEQGTPQQQRAPITLATVRVLGSWIAEETSALQSDVISVLPFLLKLCKIAFDQQRKTSTNAGATSNSSSTASGETGPTAMECSQDEDVDPDDMEDLIKFVVPGLCHLSADDGARNVLLACGGHQLLGSYFSHHYALCQQARQTQDDQTARETEVSLTTICGVFLNFVVMETQLAGTDVVFSEMLSFLLTAVPHLIESGECLVLAFNMCVLCLMLLRHQHTKLQVSQATCNHFLSSAMALLWCHRHSEAPSDGQPCHLVLKDKYVAHWEDISDLWFLGMQALCALVPLITEVEHLLLKSGWIPNIIGTLLQVQGQQVNDIVRDSYGMLLYEVASLEESKSKPIIVEKGGKQLSQMYGLLQLSEALNS